MIDVMKIIVRQAVPLVGTLGKAELEYAAACIILACQEDGEWMSVSPPQIYDAVSRTEPELHWESNPFFRPDFAGLVEAGFAIRVDTIGPHRLRLTDKCIDQIVATKRYVLP